MPRKLVDLLREKRPGLARRVDLGHPLAAIRMFCVHCVGGSSADVRRCTVTDCPLHRFRHGHRPGPIESLKSAARDEPGGEEE